MAYIRSYDTKIRSKGKAKKRYEVCWREPHPTRLGAMRSRQESYSTREAAEARRDALNNAKHSLGGTAALADAKKAGERLVAEYIESYGDLLTTRVADKQDKLKDSTAARYRQLLRLYVLAEFGGTPVGAIDAAACRKFRAALVNRPSRNGDPDSRLSASTVRQTWAVFRDVLDLALSDGAIQSNPARSTKRGNTVSAKFDPNPLTADQLGALSAALAGELLDEDGEQMPEYPVYALMVEFMAATGPRAGENAGLEIGDILRVPTRVGVPPAMSVRIERTKERNSGAWTVGTPKTEKSRRTVPLPSWLAERMADYLADHPRGDDPTAPLWPGRSMAWTALSGGKRRQNALDWDNPIDMGTFYRRVFRPALLAAGLPASEPARAATATAPATAAKQGIRVHDLRHTFATQHLSQGTPFMQVSEWLGHADYVVTMTVYADWMPAKPVENSLPAPTRPAAAARTNVVRLPAAKVG